MNRMQGKTVVITGGAGGIGMTAAKKFYEEGARVHLVDLDEEALQKAVSSLASDITYTAADVSDEEQVKQYVKEAKEKHGRIDAFLNNAGIEGKVQPIVETDVADFDKVQQVNVRGAWLGIKHVAPVMMENDDGGAIVVTSSVAGVAGTPGVAPYVTSKHAIIGLMRTAALELAPKKIRVNTVNPSPVDNRMMRSLEEGFNPDNAEQMKQQFETQIPLQRYAENEEVADLMFFLCSDEASFITGGVYMIDGGMTAS